MMSGGFGGGGFGGGGHMGPNSIRRFGEMGLDQDVAGKAYNHRVVMRLLKYIKPYWKHAVITFIALMAYTGTVIAQPLIVAWVIDDYVSTRDLSGLDLAVLVFLGVAVAQFVATYLNQRLMAYIGQNVLYTLRTQLFNHIQRLSMSFFDKNETGRVMSRVQNDVQQLQEVLSIFINSFAQVLSLIGIIGAMLFLNWKLALLTLSVIPMLFLVLNVWQRYARRSFLRVRTAIADVNSGLQENISGVRVVQSLNREETNIRRFGESNAENLNANLQASRLSAALIPSVEMLTALGLAIVVFVGGSLVLDGTIQAGVLVAFALFIQRFFEPVRSLTQEYGQLQRAMVAGDRIFEILDMKPEIEEKQDAVELPPIKGDIVYENVSFYYDEDTPVLKDVSLHIEPGQTVAFVGPTGAGKTTMVSLLLRLYDVKKGAIRVDGQDLRDLTMNSLYRQISVVPQEPYLFSGTSVKDNIRYNREHVTDEDVVRAATAVGAHEFISKLDQGYETIMNERGGNLSIGQRQLISFARALVGDPHILILDEATANIDTHSEMVIQQALKELLQGRTAVVIAHRLSTIRNAHNIVVLERGRIVEQGTHNELIERAGLYAKLSAFNSVGEEVVSNALPTSANGDEEKSVYGQRRGGRGEGRPGAGEGRRRQRP